MYYNHIYKCDYEPFHLANIVAKRNIYIRTINTKTIYQMCKICHMYISKKMEMRYCS